MNKIVTIGREFGSGGRELGRRLAEELGFAYYDREILTGIAERTALSEGYVQQVLEHRPVSLFPITVGRSLHLGGDPMLDQSRAIYQQQARILKEMAQNSNCVLVGRCADYILRDEGPFRLFVYAEMESRLRRCREKAPENEQLTDKELRQQILGVDKNRAKYYEFYTGRRWGDKLNYDLCVNTTRTGPKEAAQAIARLV